MQWRDKDTVFEVSEANTDNKVDISMDDGNNAPYGYYMQLEKHDVIRLRDWLNQAIQDLED